MNDDKPKEECGIVGIFNHPRASLLTAMMLHALQHRGQEGAGIVTSGTEKGFCAHRGPGLVSGNFPPHIIEKLLGRSAIGHVRYSTSGDNFPEKALHNLQPFFAETAFGGLGLAHNGNLTNADQLRAELISQGSIFRSSSDTEVILHLVAKNHDLGQISRIIEGLKRVKGSYSLVALNEHELIGIRDPFGIRPLILGKFQGSWILASETCALDTLRDPDNPKIEAKFVREIEPGEIVIISQNGIRSIKPFEPQSPRPCIFEYIYFARPDSIIEGQTLYDTRIRMGQILAQEHPVEADVIVPVPDSGVPAALGYAQESRTLFATGLTRNHYVGRTFIEPKQATREVRVGMKLNPITSVINGRRVVVVDDSVVRGTTGRVIIRMIRRAGAKEIHLRLSSPPIPYSCFYGIDTPQQDFLLAHKLGSVEKMRRFLEVDSLGFLSLGGVYQAIGKGLRRNDCPQACDACFTGDYPALF
jgi:amidophosphoribosyltransferase